MKRNSIFFLSLILLLFCTTVLFAGGAGEATEDSGKTYNIKITHVLDASHHYQAGAMKFKEIVEAGSGGRITVEVFPNSQLGGERVVLEALQLGTIEMGIISSGALSGFIPDFSIFDLGYLFMDNVVAQKVLYGELGNTLSAQMIEKGIRNLGFLDCGFRSVYGRAPVRKPEDLKGIKIRTMENPAHQALFRALGASPVPMAWPELYTGLQQGTVDAAENVVDVLYSSKQYEVAKHYSLTNHVYQVTMFMVSERFFQQLPANFQELVTRAAEEAIAYENQVFLTDREKALSSLKAAGVQIYTLPNLGPFQEMAKKSWGDLVKTLPNGQKNLEIILREIGN